MVLESQSGYKRTTVKYRKGLRPSDTDDNEHEDENGGNVARTFASVVPIADSKRSKSE